MWDADTYSKNCSIQKKNAKKIMQKVSLNKKNDTILDVGCGNGALTYEMAAYTNQTLGIDISSEMISFATKKYCLEGLSFVQASYDQINKLQPQFNLVTCFSAMHWFKEIDLFILDVANLLKRNSQQSGRIVGVTYPRNNLFWDIANELAESNFWKNHFTDFTNFFYFRSQSDYQRILKRAGFKNISVEYSIHNQTLPNSESLYRSTQSWLPYTLHLKKTYLKQKFAEQFCKQYLDSLGQVPQKNKAVTIPCHTLEIYAEN